eukprot:6202224-Pleurochrysis_carterae.AAC.2
MRLATFWRTAVNREATARIGGTACKDVRCPSERGGAAVTDGDDPSRCADVFCRCPSRPLGTCVLEAADDVSIVSLGATSRSSEDTDVGVPILSVSVRGL